MHPPNAKLEPPPPFQDAPDANDEEAEVEEVEDECCFGFISKVEASKDGVIIVVVTFPGNQDEPKGTTEDMTLADALAHLVPFHEMSLKQLAALPKSLLAKECGTEGRKLPKIAGKKAADLAQVLLDELVRVANALPELAASREEEEEGTTVAVGAPGGPPLGGGGEAPQAADAVEEEGSEASGGQLGQLTSQLHHSQLVSAEKLNAVLCVLEQRLHGVDELLEQLGVKGPAPDVKELAASLQGRTDLCQLALMTRSCLKELMATLRFEVEKLLVYKVMDLECTRAVTVARFALNGSTSAKKQLLMNEYVVRKFEECAKRVLATLPECRLPVEPAPAAVDAAAVAVADAFCAAADCTDAADAAAADAAAWAAAATFAIAAVAAAAQPEDEPMLPAAAAAQPEDEPMLPAAAAAQPEDEPMLPAAAAAQPEDEPMPAAPASAAPSATLAAPPHAALRPPLAMVVGMLVTDGEACNREANPRPGDGPSTLKEARSTPPQRARCRLSH
jgi:hypothetical protein